MALLTGSRGDFLRALGSAQTYKPGQGIRARNGTLIAAIVLIVAGVYSWSRLVPDVQLYSKWVVPLAIALPLAWVAYRLIHYPRFADFSITTEAEMNKVSWPAWPEVKISTAVVLVTVLCMSVFLFGTDLFWKWLLTIIGVLRMGGALETPRTCRHMER